MQQQLTKIFDDQEKLAASYSQIESYLQCPQQWYRRYVLGERTLITSIALAYGSSIHQTIEWFYKHGMKASEKDLIDTWEDYAFLQNIPYTNEEDKARDRLDAYSCIRWLLSVYSKPIDHLTPLELALREGEIVGVEEPFVLPYKLPLTTTVDGKDYNEVVLNGSIDMHVKTKDGHIIIDWKSGKKLFDNNKLNTNLQHPIYSFYVLRKYNEGLPARNYYVFTRTHEYQVVNVDVNRVKNSVDILTKTFGDMYDFKKNANQKCCPSALCYWCEFTDCKMRSQWKPKK